MGFERIVPDSNQGYVDPRGIRRPGLVGGWRPVFLPVTVLTPAWIFKAAKSLMCWWDGHKIFVGEDHKNNRLVYECARCGQVMFEVPLKEVQKDPAGCGPSAPVIPSSGIL